MKFEKNLKLHAPKTWLAIRSFNKEEDDDIAPNSIYKLIDEEILELEANDKFMLAFNGIQTTWNQELEETLENFVFESIYGKIFIKKVSTGDYKSKNFQLQENIYILQNLLTMDLLQIPNSFQIPSLFLICSNDLRKINQAKSPL